MGRRTSNRGWTTGRGGSASGDEGKPGTYSNKASMVGGAIIGCSPSFSGRILVKEPAEARAEGSNQRILAIRRGARHPGRVELESQSSRDHLNVE